MAGLSESNARLSFTAQNFSKIVYYSTNSNKFIFFPTSFAPKCFALLRMKSICSVLCFDRFYFQITNISHSEKFVILQNQSNVITCMRLRFNGEFNSVSEIYLSHSNAFNLSHSLQSSHLWSFVTRGEFTAV